MGITLEAVKIEKPENANIIIGQSHFIKTVEDIYEAMVNAGGTIKFGVAFCEASGPCLIRSCGNDEELKSIAVRNATRIAAGHTFIVVMTGGFPINVLNSIKNVPEVCSIFCATANPTEVIVASTESGRGIMGVVDGSAPKGVEGPDDVNARHSFLRKIGYKL